MVSFLSFNLKKKSSSLKNLCQLQFVTVNSIPYFINDDESHFAPRGGGVCTVSELIGKWIDKSEPGRLFSIYTLNSGWENWMKPISDPLAPSRLARKNESRSCNQRSHTAAPHPAVPPSSSSHGQRDDLMNHTPQGAWRFFFFFLCPSVFQSPNPNIFMWRQCWNPSPPQKKRKEKKSSSKLSFTASVFECDRAGGACSCNMVLTFGSLFVAS